MEKVKTIKKDTAVNNKTKNTTDVKILATTFPIVGIGASAGGLEALETFFSNMPASHNIAFFVIQHLAPNQVSMLAEILQRSTSMKVIQAREKLPIKPGYVYIIPPKKNIAILGHLIHLSSFNNNKHVPLTIDFFFESLAETQKSKSIGIILSGMGSDGSLGVKAIKEKNGLVLVQDPKDAKFDSMPLSAINTINVNIIAPAKELPKKLIQLIDLKPQSLLQPNLEIFNKEVLDKIIVLLRDQTGNDFSLYKKNTLLRRIERRISIHRIDNIDNYLRFLKENPVEVEILFKELLIGVTGFFRDPAVWAKLQQEILPDLINKLDESQIFRAWVTGCSTGEEAYSLALSLKMIQDQTKKYHLKFQIFATDLDQDAIEKARKGVFTAKVVADIAPEILNRYFEADRDNFRVNNTIREMVIFAPHNVIKDPPFTKLHLLMCRNMLIYMEPTLQEKLFTLFNYSLTPGGIMVLGNAETIGNLNDFFDTIDNRLKIYRSSSSNNTPKLLDFPSSFSMSKKQSFITKSNTRTDFNIQTLTNQVLLQRFAPASILVNNKGEIIYIIGRTGKYLEAVTENSTWNIFTMARDGLFQTLPNAFRSALKTCEPVILNNIKIGSNENTQTTNVTIQQLENPEALKGMFIIVFNDVSDTNTPINNISDSNHLPITNLQMQHALELKQSFEELQNTRELMQSSQEELKSANEELQSTNEELQSTNEELTTSKEELQSLNEELQTVNIELQSKVNDLVNANNDMNNLLNSTEIATLFLDKDFNIRRFTDQVTKIFKIRNIDIGRPITELVNNLNYSSLDELSHQVLNTLIPKETEVTSTENKWYRIRIMPYRTLDDRIDGLVLTFTDITKSKKLELELKNAYDELQIINTTKEINANIDKKK
jgi:two-component system CheB/CheR fusion protein